MESQISAFVQGALPAYLSPFSQDHKIYIPVISKTEVGQSLLRRVSVIFVEADVQKLRPMFDWKMPDAMPEQLVSFAALMRLMLRVRYDILEPTYQDLRYRTASLEDARAMGQCILAAYETIRQDSRKARLRGGDALYLLFDSSLKPKIDTAIEGYVVAIKALAALVSKLNKESDGERDWSTELLDALGALRENNARWLDIAAAQFTIFVQAWR
jgi:hypothetical protein